MGVTILMTIAVNMLVRSLALGLAISLCWFPADNIGTRVMGIAAEVTHSTFWLDITAYFLGPNINTMPTVLIPGNLVASPGFPPMVSVTGDHTLWVVFVYALIFAVAALLLTKLRDVRE
jgi:ABC-2 type transport system permease protein